MTRAALRSRSAVGGESGPVDRFQAEKAAAAAGFPGHFEDDETELTYMQARYYDPLLGRFLSPDPIGYQDQLNLYAYVANDPVNKTDPTGEFMCCADNTDPEKDPSSKAGKENTSGETAQRAGATKDFADNYDEMRRGEGVWVEGRDKYYHCKANCEATKRGKYGEDQARRMSDKREEKQTRRAKGDRGVEKDSEKDQEANRRGRENGKKPESCKKSCGADYGRREATGNDSSNNDDSNKKK
jgi:RHS repeat-associated protein